MKPFYFHLNSLDFLQILLYFKTNETLKLLSLNYKSIIKLLYVFQSICLSRMKYHPHMVLGLFYGFLSFMDDIYLFIQFLLQIVCHLFFKSYKNIFLISYSFLFLILFLFCLVFSLKRLFFYL